MRHAAAAPASASRQPARAHCCGPSHSSSQPLAGEPTSSSVASRSTLSCRKPAVNRQLWATANGGRHKAMRPGRGVAEWHMLPSWNSLHTLLVARAVLLWHGASYPVLRCSSLARHPDLGPPTVPCARRPLFWYPIPVRIGSPTGDAWLTCQCASQSACSAFHNIRRLSLPSLVGEGTSHCAICWLRLVPWGATRQVENPLRWLCQSSPGPLPAYASPIEPVVSLLY